MYLLSFNIIYFFYLCNFKLYDIFFYKQKFYIYYYLGELALCH